MNSPLNTDQQETVHSKPKVKEDFRNSLMQNILTGSVILGTALFIICLYVFVQMHNTAGVVFSILIFSFLFCATFITRLSLKFRAVTLYLVFLTTGLLSFYFSGLNSNGLIFLFISVLIIGVFGNRKQWAAAVFFSGLCSLILGFLIQSQMVNRAIFVVEKNSLFYWVVSLTLLLFLMFVIVLPLVLFLRNIENEYTGLVEKHKFVDDANLKLNEQVSSLQTEITNQLNQIIYTRKILRETASQKNTAAIMNELVENLRSNYDLLFVGIYLPAENNEFLELRAYSEEPGWMPVSPNEQVKVIDIGITGIVFKTGSSKTNLLSGLNRPLIENELVVGSINELAFPLRAGEKVIGVLYLQSAETNKFPPDFQQIFQSISDQTAILIDKSLMIDDLQQGIRELEESLMQETKYSWRTHLLGSRKKLCYQYTRHELQPKDFVGEDEISVIKENKKKIVSLEQSANSSENSSLYVPIVVNKNPVGVIRIKTEQPRITREMEELVSSIADRLSAAIENARLLEEIQQRADREKSISDIVRKTRDANDIETILQTTARELGNSLGIDEVHIQLRTQEL